MPLTDFWLIIRFWGTIFLVGSAAFPLTKKLFPNWYDHGYSFAKAIGLAIVGWTVLVLGMARIMPFTVTTVLCVTAVMFGIGILFHSTKKEGTDTRVRGWVMVTEEVFFLAALCFWSWVKAHEPSIRGLEKFMDYGFMNSILQSSYFPALDMWYPPEFINYYYFGHLITAILTKVSGIGLAYTFNLMLAAIFAWTLTMSFSIGYQLWHAGKKHVAMFSGVLTALLVTMAGNMQTLYAFTRGYTGDAVKPFWQLWWPVKELLQRLPEGMETYWYANATRFIPYAIHEFPSYSFVVSDVHGHVLSLPFVLLAIGLLLQITNRSYTSYASNKTNMVPFIFYGFLCGILLMTNALDGPIYFGLLMVLSLLVKEKGEKLHWKQIGIRFGLTLCATIATSMPFLFHFTSFVHGVALNCPPAFLANSHIGPLLFEGVEKCQRSPLWMLWILWGFFWYCGIWFIITKATLVTRGQPLRQSIYQLWNNKFTQLEKVLCVFFFFSILLIIFPEFFYFKDIYPMHFRSNTMFKLGYQAFILFSIVSAYAIVWYIVESKKYLARAVRIVFMVLLLPQLFLVLVYPIFSVRSYFNSLRVYDGVYGLNWLYAQFPDDYTGIEWLRTYDMAHPLPNGKHSILLEADGDSYTDYQRYSVFTGIPTPIGWAVHEWLWRGSYEVVAPRRDHVREMYESEDIERTKELLNFYQVRYIVVGTLERQKFTKLYESKFSQLARVAYVHGETVIYELVNPRIDK